MDDSEIERHASNINFLSEWRYFNYEPRVIRFVPGTGCSSSAKPQNEITLSQFTAAEVSKCSMEEELGLSSPVTAQSRKDFILYAGGLVWALDWCPRSEQESESGPTCEFIAVAAHPPDSNYHKLGAPLSGRGMIQIWCLLNYATNEETQITGSTKQKYKKTAMKKKAEKQPGRPRGRPRKNPINNTPDANLGNHVDKDSQSVFAFQNILDIAPLSECSLSTPHADKDSQDISASQSMSDPVYDNMQSQKSVIESNNITYKRRKRKPRESTMDEALVDLLESQFIPPLNVQLPDATDVFTFDENDNDPIKKQKAVNNVNDDVTDSERPSLQPDLVAYPESVTNYSPTGVELMRSSTPEVGKRRKLPTRKVLENDLDFTIAAFKMKSRKKSKFLKDPHFDNDGSSTPNNCNESLLSRATENVLEKDGIASHEHVVGSNLTNLEKDMSSGGCHEKKNNVLPKAVLCLGHDGKVAWDVKWRPIGVESINKYRMGYLAVVLGNGSIEVWEVPSPEVVNRVYAFRQTKDTDPRFAKLKPVFRCSKLNHGDRLSIPLIVEWSASPPHDLILAGCHDGLVAVWKFSTKGHFEDARPLLCFSAETGPIRALMWAPFDGDHESSNVIVTAGHGGLKFWDLRDPYRPLWDANPSQRYIYGLDWLPDPRCILVTYDDGNLRMLSLLRSAYDVPVTGEPFSGTQQQGLHSYNCSTSAIWSIHVSRLTGVVAYCCADGAVLYFQLTHKAVEKDPCRNRAPHFLCGSLLASEGSAVTLNTELPNFPHRMKKSATEWANTPRSARTVASSSKPGKTAKKGPVKSPSDGDEVLALCYGDDSESGEANETPKSTKSRSVKTSKSKSPTSNQELLDVDGERATNSSKKTDVKNEAQCEVEAPLPKLQAMYRVRWNMNKGSERWLCYGGAAGIVRCQEIVIPEYDKKLLKR